VLLAVLDNNFIASTRVWDVVWEGAALEIRGTSVRGAVSVRLRFAVPNRILVERLDTWHDGHHIEVASDGMIGLDGRKVAIGDMTIHVSEGWANAALIAGDPTGGVAYGAAGGGRPLALAGGLQVAF